jgi:hypothetical protein
VSLSRIVTGFATVGLVVADLAVLHNAELVLVLGAAGGAMVTKRIGDRTAAEWLPIASRFLAYRALGINKFRSTRPWRAIVTGEPAAEVEQILFAELPTSWEGPLAGVRLLAFRPEVGAPEIGVLTDGSRYRAVMAISGGHSLTMLDTPDALNRLEEWADMLASCVRQGHPFSRLQTLLRLSADNGLAWAAYRRQHAKLPVGHPIRDNVEAATKEQSPTQRSRTAYLVAEIDLADVPSDTLRQSGGGDIGACRVLASRIQNALAGSLADAGVSVDEVLGARAVAKVLRLTFDPFSDRAIAARQEAGGEAGVDPGAVEPDSLDLGWHSVRSDRSWLIGGYVREHPQADIHVSALSRLMLGPECECVISLVLEPQQRQRMKGQATKALAKGETASAVLQTWGINDNPFRAKARDAAEDLAHAVADGAAVYRHNLYVLVAGRTPLEAEDAWADVEIAGATAGCEIGRMYGQQDAALAACLPLCRGV